MIPALILYLIRKVKRKSKMPYKEGILKNLVLKLKSVLFSLAIIVCLSFERPNKNETVTYNVLKNDNKIGTIEIDKEEAGNVITYTLSSDLDVKLLLKIDIISREKSIYQNGILTYSSVLRKINNKVKTDHSIVLKGGKYILQQPKENSQILDFGTIKHGLITLYFKEPKNVNTVFCDNLNEKVPVKPLGSGKYKVEFSKGKYNVFHYKNGKCVKVEANSSLFNVELIPSNL